MSDVAVWYMIPRLVVRYGQSGARAVTEVLAKPGHDPIPGYIVRADACLSDGDYVAASALYACAARVSASTGRTKKTVGLYEAALLCAPNHSDLRTEMILFLCKTGWFWRVSDYMHVHASFVSSDQPIGYWLAILSQITLDLILHRSLLCYLVTIIDAYSLKKDHAELMQSMQRMQERSTQIQWEEWRGFLQTSSDGGKRVLMILIDS